MLQFKSRLALLLTTIFLSSHAVLQFDCSQELEKIGVQFAECAFADIDGNLRAVTIPINGLDNAVKFGLYFDSSSVPGCSTVNDSDMCLKLDLDSCILLPEPLRKYKTVMIMCDIYLSPDEPYAGCSRTLLKKQIDKLKNKGLAFGLSLELKAGAELEFYIINKENECVDDGRYFDISIDPNMEYHKQLALDVLTKAGIPAEKIHHEVAPGQYEVTFRYGDCLKTADNVLFTKYIIRSLAKLFNATALFMPKPFTDENGSGMHIHYSLYDTIQQKNIFCDNNNPQALSDISQAFIAGNLKYMPELSALFNPSINSFKRLVPDREAPVYICWGIKNRSALIRIPLVGAENLSACRAELRSPDASCNPYLALAAISGSGLKGILDQLIIPNPVAGNLYKLSIDQIKRIGITCLPRSLEDALNNLKNSSFAEEVLGTKLLNEFLNLRQRDVESFNKRNELGQNELEITEWELSRYI